MILLYLVLAVGIVSLAIGVAVGETMFSVIGGGMVGLGALLAVVVRSAAVTAQRERKQLEAEQEVAERLAALRQQEIDERERELTEKYGPEAADKILSRIVWQGETEEQVRASLGDPEAEEETVLKTKTKRVWKYEQTGPNRFGLRIFIEDGEVIGWERK